MSDCKLSFCSKSYMTTPEIFLLKKINFMSSSVNFVLHNQTIFFGGIWKVRLIHIDVRKGDSNIIPLMHLKFLANISCSNMQIFGSCTQANIKKYFDENTLNMYV